LQGEAISRSYRQRGMCTGWGVVIEIVKVASRLVVTWVYRACDAVITVLHNLA